MAARHLSLSEYKRSAILKSNFTTKTEDYHNVIK